jgi:hypothetical protein
MQPLLAAAQAPGYIPNAAASKDELHGFAAKPPADTAIWFVAPRTSFRVQTTKTLSQNEGWSRRKQS